MSGFDILLQAANHRYDDTDNNNIVDGTEEAVALSTNTNSQAASLYTNYISSSSSSNNLPPKKRIKLTNNHSTTCSIDGISNIISNATNNNTNSTHNSISSSSSTTLKKTKSWNNSTYIQFRTNNNLNNNWDDNDSMSVSTIGMRSVSSCNNTSSSSRGGIGVRGLSRGANVTTTTTYSSKKNEVWNTLSSLPSTNADSPTLISNDTTINDNMLRRERVRREGERDEGSSLHQLYNMSLVIPTTKKQRKQSTRKFYKRGGFDKEVGKGGPSSCTDVNGIEMGMGYFSSSLSTASRSSTTLSPSDLRQRGKKKRPRTEEVVEVPQDVLSTTTGTKEEEVPRDNSIKSEEIPQEQGQGKNKRSRPPALLQEEERLAIVVNVSTPPSKLNNNGLMNENAKYLIAKSQLYQAYLQALNQNQD